MMNVRPKRLFAVFACAALFANAGMAAASADTAADKADVTVSSPAEFAAALRNTRYKTIALAPGDYGNVTLSSLPAGIRIGAAEPTKPPVFSGLTISNVDDLTLANIAVKLNAPPKSKYQSLVNIEDAKNLRLTGLTLNGAAAPPETEFRGVLLHKSSQVTVSDCSFSGFYRALVGLAVDQVTLTHNDISEMSSDGFNFAQARNVTIARNRFGAFQTTAESHADYVQFWSTGTDEASSNITVAENLMLQGQGAGAQGIFLEFEPRLPAHNVTVRDNVIIQSSPHGISLYNVVGATVQRNLAVAAPISKYKVAIRMIGVSDGRVSNNISNAYGFEATRNVTREGNTEIDFNDKRALANTVQAIQNFLDGSPARPLVGQVRIAEAIRSAGIRPPESRR